MYNDVENSENSEGDNLFIISENLKIKINDEFVKKKNVCWEWDLNPHPFGPEP